MLQTIEAAAAQLDAAGVSFGHGTTNAFDEAAWLVLWQLKLPLHEFDLHQNRVLTTAESTSVATLLGARIETRKPAAYLTNEAWLQGVPFYVDERVIVPRSLIAELLADADGNGTLDYWLRPETQNVLDLCTGNGSLAVLAALNFPEVRVQAADISHDALAVAAINIAKHALQNRIELTHSDGLAQCKGVRGMPYDLILCNPPYVSSGSMATLPAEYKAEPNISLAGGADGMDFIGPMLRALPSVMGEHAVLVLEIGNEREHFERAFPRNEAIWLDTSAGADQVLLLQRNSLIA